jgi:hypothetical protein
MARVKLFDNSEVCKWLKLFQNFLSCHMPTLNSQGDQGHFWWLGDLKMTCLVPELFPSLTRVMKQKTVVRGNSIKNNGIHLRVSPSNKYSLYQTERSFCQGQMIKFVRAFKCFVWLQFYRKGAYEGHAHDAQMSRWYDFILIHGN